MKRETKEEHEANHERWLVSYADFITLMFAFFAVLYATSEKDLEKAKEFQESIKRYLIKAGSFGESGQQINQGEKNNQLIEPPIPTFRPSKPELAETLDRAERFIEEKFTPEQRKKYISDLGADQWGVRITLNSSALFAAGNEKFRPDAVKFLDQLSEILPLLKRRVLIEGHAAPDEKGNTRSTWDFASARAINLLRYVQTKQKLRPNQLVAASFGDSRPVYQGERMPLNSRIEIVLLHQDIEL